MGKCTFSRPPCGDLTRALWASRRSRYGECLALETRSCGYRSEQDHAALIPGGGHRFAPQEVNLIGASEVIAHSDFEALEMTGSIEANVRLSRAPGRLSGIFLHYGRREEISTRPHRSRSAFWREVGYRDHVFADEIRDAFPPTLRTPSESPAAHTVGSRSRNSRARNQPRADDWGEWRDNDWPKWPAGRFKQYSDEDWAQWHKGKEIEEKRKRRGRFRNNAIATMRRSPIRRSPKPPPDHPIHNRLPRLKKTPAKSETEKPKMPGPPEADKSPILAPAPSTHHPKLSPIPSESKIPPPSPPP